MVVAESSVGWDGVERLMIAVVDVGEELVVGLNAERVSRVRVLRWWIAWRDGWRI